MRPRLASIAAPENRERYLFWLVFLAGLLNGLLYIFIIPPWQHYDEPTQFEYAWLIANRPGLPNPGDYDQSMRRELAASMVEHGFFRDMDIQPDLLAQSEPVWIGISQTGDPPLYYWLAALPLRLLRWNDVTLQLYAARNVSLLFFMITLLAAYGVAGALRLSPAWLLPAMLALSPGFVDLMTSVNNDVGAVAFFSLFLWSGIRLVRGGFHWPSLVGLLASAAGCFWTKNTAVVAVPLAALAIVLAGFPGARRKVAWGLLLAGALAAGLALFSGGGVAHWTPQPGQSATERGAIHQTPLGFQAFRLVVQPKASTPALYQILSGDQIQQLIGQPLTIGAWIWASNPTSALPPYLQGDGASKPEVAPVGMQPIFVAYHTSITDSRERLLFLAPAASEQEGQLEIYYDGVVLATGSFPLDVPPEFDDQNAKSGTWAGQPFTNLVQNPSAEQAWPRVRPATADFLAGFFPSRPELALTALLEWPKAVWYYRAAARNLFITWWARFGWGHVPLLGFHPYLVLGCLSLAGLAGALVFVWRRKACLPWDAVILLALALIYLWGAALLRGVGSLTGEVFIPAARYAAPAILPTALMLLSGWREIFFMGERRLDLPPNAKAISFWVFFLSMNFFGITSILVFYYLV